MQKRNPFLIRILIVAFALFFGAQLKAEEGNDEAEANEESAASAEAGPDEESVIDNGAIASDEPVAIADIKKSAQRDPRLLKLPIAQTHEGVLRKARNRLIFFRPPYPYELVDASGNHMIYVDLTGAVYPPPLSQYLNGRVTLSGKVETTGKNSRKVVLKASNLGKR